MPFLFIDTAGLREGSGDEIELIGIDRAKGEVSRADVVLWLGEEGQGPDGAWEVAARCDAEDFVDKISALARVSATTGEGVSKLKARLVAYAREALPKPGEAALNARQHGLLDQARHALLSATQLEDPLLIGEELRSARVAFDRLVGRSTTEDMLDALFGRFCIGK